MIGPEPIITIIFVYQLVKFLLYALAAGALIYFASALLRGRP